MKYTTATALLSLLGTAAAWSNMEECGKRSPTVVNAIGKFCQNPSIVVPSTQADNGGSGYSENTKVKITGTCSPPQWVPTYWCMQQFYDVCATSEDPTTGSGGAHYGNNGCQYFQIANSVAS
ncbi:hypothetical protein LTR62_003170 [Meristemomyces frigidus]|uniref:Uncharacterized protein n=1 Tax=Meristemomyces frigidus TaxID=1508187 RepID=A0AAN7TGE5_9PEZI|nr:hypothetical protein LTR62_003170 [Meristemomyces frigidus]